MCHNCRQPPCLAARVELKRVELLRMQSVSKMYLIRSFFSGKISSCEGLCFTLGNTVTTAFRTDCIVWILSNCGWETRAIFRTLSVPSHFSKQCVVHQMHPHRLRGNNPQPPLSAPALMLLFILCVGREAEYPQLLAVTAE